MIRQYLFPKKFPIIIVMLMIYCFIQILWIAKNAKTKTLNEYKKIEIRSKLDRYVFAIFVMAAVILLYSITICILIHNGMTAQELQNMPYANILTIAENAGNGAKLNPIPKEFPQQGQYAVYYFRFDNETSIDMMDDIIPQINEKTTCYTVSTKSTEGQKLLEQYPTDIIPSLVYVNSYGESITCDPLIIRKNQIEIDEQELNKFLDYIETNEISIKRTPDEQNAP